MKTLVFIPTYNERNNIRPLVEKIQSLKLEVDFLLLDDHSPDGTGAVMDSLAALFSNIHVIHRSGKLGIGSAHKDGIRWAYDHGYTRLVTLDADFTHSPESIPELLKAGDEANLVITTRFQKEEGLAEWNFYRKCLTRLGHWLTRRILKIEYDATGAFRLYRLDQLPKNFLDLVQSDTYPFFFESLFILVRCGFTIKEVPVVLPRRHHGSSKMSWTEIPKGLWLLMALYFRERRERREWQLALSA